MTKLSWPRTVYVDPSKQNILQ